MIHTYTETSRFANVALSGGPSPIGTWLKAAVLRLLKSPPREQPQRNRVQEAAEVRTLAESIRRTDPRFAADLFAAADHHEALAD